MTGSTELFGVLASAAPPVDLTLLKNIALIVFFAIFVGIGIRLLLTRRGEFDRAARMPLDDAGTEERGRHG